MVLFDIEVILVQKFVANDNYEHFRGFSLVSKYLIAGFKIFDINVGWSHHTPSLFLAHEIALFCRKSASPPHEDGHNLPIETIIRLFTAVANI